VDFSFGEIYRPFFVAGVDMAISMLYNAFTNQYYPKKARVRLEEIGLNHLAEEKPINGHTTKL